MTVFVFKYFFLFMHCVFSYDLAATGERRRDIEDHILSILAPYRNVRRLTTFFIVHVQTQEQWNDLLGALTDYLRPMPERAHFILSPPMSGGVYNGLLGGNEWTEINEISRM